ncbi:hypothetical protein [Rheinheimera sp.]|uniref:hypothetical protein n=1 Tax=Rheinheimera sp. TaxID=1869214 RepID=UPI00273493C3|nr:hypothetical protein [Rheinheimera sp.]MDP2713278.1 hypothetical protein [Rheinheimera sp.]
MDFKTLLHKPELKPALVIGNGINRYNSVDNESGWDKLLIRLWRKRVGAETIGIPVGISLTEFYDALDLKGVKQSKSLQAEFCELMSNWPVKEQHKKIVSWAETNNTPILTTNFENTLSDVLNLKIGHLDSDKFTDFYPWGSFYSNKNITYVTDDFAIWHINGVQKYSRSIRLGLSHYMGSVERARPMLHKGSNRLFNSADFTNWPGKNTWLNIIFQNDLFIFGLDLGTTEVFLRWLLIERAKFFKIYSEKKRQAFYIHVGEIQPGQRLFLESVGIQIVTVVNYDGIYAAPW